jgi:hypothetical protein
VWCITTIVPGAPIVCNAVRDRIASMTLPPAFWTIVAPIPSHQNMFKENPSNLPPKGDIREDRETYEVQHQCQVSDRDLCGDQSRRLRQHRL